MRPLKTETLDPPRTRRRRSRTWRVATLAAALSAAPLLTIHLPALGTRPTPHPVKASRHEVALQRTSLAAVRQAGPTRPEAGVADPAATARAAAIAAPQDVTHGVSVVGVTWTRGSEVSATDQFQIRTLTGAVWSPWETLDRDSSHRPDDTGADRAEGQQAEEGTQPYVVTGATKFEVRALASDGTAPTGAHVQVIDPGTSTADSAVGAPQGGSAVAAAGMPTIYTRAQWGADESLRRGSPSYGQTQVAYVHHTDSANNYTAADVPAIIRGIYAYHVQSNGWDDIGYNFLVDRFGRIWEGRYGGMDKAVIGAHTLNYNSWSFGVSAIGNFVSTAPSQGMVDAIKRVIAWKFSLAGVPATGTVFARDKWFNRISGHRDAFQTTCPGQYLYDKLPEIRSGVAALMGRLPAATLSRDVDRAGGPDLLSYPAGAAGQTVLLRGASTQPVVDGHSIGTGWNVLRSVAVSPDFSGDSLPDVLAIDPARGTLRVYRGDGRGGFSGSTARGTGWADITRLMPAGDRDGDGFNDLIGTSSGGQLKLYSGDGHGWIRATTVIGRSGWNAMRWVAPVGDVTGDGLPDLYAVRASDGALLLYPGTAGGGLGAPLVRGGGWSSLSPVFGGDLDQDGLGDLVARAADGTMRMYYGTGGGFLNRATTWGHGWGGLGQLSTGVDWDGDGRPDVLAVNAAASGGALLLYPGTGARDFSAPPVALTLPAGADLARVVGDVNGDGYADVLVRNSTQDQLLLYPGGPGGRLGSPVVVGSGGWNAMTLIEPAGDLDYDGVPDVLARTGSGALYLYGFTRGMSFKPRTTIGNSGWDTMTSVVGVGAFNGDANADVAALRASDHAILLYRGSGPTPLLDSATMATNQDDLVQLVGSGDYNGDGRADIIARSANGTLWLYTGNGTGGLTGSRQPLRTGEGTINVIG